LVTFVAVALAAWWWPDYVHAEEINALGYGGAVLVVLGSAPWRWGVARRAQGPAAAHGVLSAQHVLRADPLVELSSVR
jgi:hypothetical protein